MVVILDADLPGPGAEVILSRIANDVALARHAYIYLTRKALDQLSLSLRELLSGLGAAVLQTPVTTEGLLGIMRNASQRSLATALPNSPNALAASRRS